MKKSRRCIMLHASWQLKPKSRLVGQLVGRRSSGVQDQQNNGQSTTDRDKFSPGRVVPAVLADLELHIGGKCLHLLGAELVVNKSTKSNGVAKELLGSDGVAEDHHGGANEKNVLQDTSHGQDDSGGLANQEHNRCVKQESDQGVGNKSHDTKRVNVVHSHTGKIGEKGDNAVGDGAGRGVVV